MWPMLLDYTKEESKRILRRIELEAYASIISVFRAQGDLSKEKKKILQDLQQTLSISTERHRAEVRRAINDEKLATIADNVSGSLSTTEWMIEGRRLVPLMPRLVPQTMFTATANQAASAMAEKNASLPPPSQTWNKDGQSSVVPKTSRSSSPSSNVVVLPSGTSIHIKGMLNQEEDEELGVPARRTNRSLSTDSQNASSVSTQTPRITYTTASSTVPSMSPVKITISKSPQGRPALAQSSSQAPKVILVTSAGSVSGTTVMQRSMSVPVVRTPPTTLSTMSGTGPPRSSVLVPGVSGAAMGHTMAAYPGVVTSCAPSSSVSSTVTMPTSAMGSSPAMFSPSVQIGLGKVRPRIVPRQRYPGIIPPQKPAVVIPVGPQLTSPAQTATSGVTTPSQQSSTGIQVTPVHHTPSGIQVKTLSKPTIQIKQEGGMKIISQTGTSKILPKPSQITGGSGTPVVMVNTGQSSAGSASTVTMLPRTISTYTAHSGGKVLNITTPGGRVIATTTKATNVVTVNPKTLHLTAVKSGSGGTTVSKPNVIVVQKTQHPRLPGSLGHGGASIRTISSSNLPGTIDKELMGLVHKDSQGRHVLTAQGSTAVTSSSAIRTGERRVIITTSSGSGEVKQPVSIIHRGRADSEGKTSSLLAELIQAAGIMPSDATIETNVQGTDPFDMDTLDSMQVQQEPAASSSQPVAGRQHQSSLVVPDRGAVRDATDIGFEESQAQGMQSGSRRTSQDDNGGEQGYSLEQAMSLLNKEIVDLTEAESSANSSSTPSSILPSILNPTSVHPAGTQVQGQPKQVSILASTAKILGTSRRESSSAPPQVIPQEKSGDSFIVTDGSLGEGQLDTQTGLFYPVKSQSSSYNIIKSIDSAPSSLATLQHLSRPQTSTITTTTISSTTPLTPTLSSSSRPPVDLLSSSLAEAQIELDSYFDEADSDSETGEALPGVADSTLTLMDGQDAALNSSGGLDALTGLQSRPAMAEVLREETAKDGTRILTVSNPASTQQDSVAHSTQLVSLPSQLTRTSTLSSAATTTSSPSTSFVSVQDTRPSVKTVNIVPHTASGPVVKTNPLPIAVSVEPSPSVITFKLDELTSQQVELDDQLPFPEEEDGPRDAPPAVENSQPAVPVVEVETLEPGGTPELTVRLDAGAPNKLDTLTSHPESATALVQEDLLSSTAGSGSDSQGESLTSSDASGLVRTSSRKRKLPSSPDDSAQSGQNSWVGVASSLLVKICRFKGSPRDRNEIPAAEWFRFPVDPGDAPDYYTVIQNPMDFSSMRKKLESGEYNSFEEFQQDMDLIRSNCYLYNSQGTKVRRDCDQVMAYYRSELAKLQDKQTTKTFMVNSSPMKRQRPDDKPVLK